MPTNKSREDSERGRSGLASTLLAVGGIACAWAAIELAFKPWLQSGRQALNKSLDPNYDVDDELDRISSHPPSKPTPSEGDEESGEEKKVAAKDPSI